VPCVDALPPATSSENMQLLVVDSVRKGLKHVRHAGSGRVVVYEGDHWPTRTLTVKLVGRSDGDDDDDDDDDDKEDTTDKKITTAAAGESSNNLVVVHGGGGQPRVWGQWEFRGKNGIGAMIGMSCSYITRASVKPTVLVMGSGTWNISVSDVRSKGAVALVATETSHVTLSRCGIGGLGKNENRATNAMSIHGSCRIHIKDKCVVEWADLGGARFYGCCTATVVKMLVRDVGWYGILVDHNATVRAWNCRVERCGRGALATSIQSQNCALYSGNITIGQGVSEWWGPQRPGTEDRLTAPP